MGQRANFVVVQPEGYELYYSHSGASTVDRDVFFGPAYTLEYFRRQRPVKPEDGWLDDVWAEGGALIDAERRVLVYFGGEDTLYDLPQRRIHQAMLAHAWPGWDLRWAHEGLCDFADYLGLSRDVVRSRRDRAELRAVHLEAAFYSVLVSWAGRLYPVTQTLQDVLQYGPALLPVLKKLRGTTELQSAEFPRAGLHIDEEKKLLEFWSASPVPDLPLRVGTLWPGWQATFLKDDCERHLTRLGGLRLPPIDREAVVADLCGYLGRGASGAPLQSMLAFLEGERAAGKSVEVNPYALREDPFEIDDELRRLMVAEAARAYLASFGTAE